MFEKSRIILRAERIRMGLLMDEWIGVGVMCASREKLIGCCFSRSIGRVRGERGPRPPKRRILPPDDDPDFLRKL